MVGNVKVEVLEYFETLKIENKKKKESNFRGSKCKQKIHDICPKIKRLRKYTRTTKKIVKK